MIVQYILSSHVCSLTVSVHLSLVRGVLKWLPSSYTHPFNGPFSGTTRVSQYQKGKTNLDFTEAIERVSGSGINNDRLQRLFNGL